VALAVVVLEGLALKALLAHKGLQAQQVHRGHRGYLGHKAHKASKEPLDHKALLVVVALVLSPHKEPSLME
jgi:hypothetical protein